MGVKLRHRNTKKGKSYYLDIHAFGERWKETLKIPYELAETERLKIAEFKASERNLNLYDDGGYKKKKIRNFNLFFADYIQGYTKKDIKKFIQAYKHFKKRFGKTIYTTSINNNLILDWREYLENQFNGATPNTIWRAFRKVIKKAVVVGFLESDPMVLKTGETIKAPKETREVKKEVLTPREIKLINEYRINLDNKKGTGSLALILDAFLFCCFTGLTYFEIMAVDPSYLDGDVFKYKRRKTGSKVKMSLSEGAKMILKRNPKYFKLLPSDTAARYKLKKAIKEIGINKNITFYCARHTFATLLLMSGSDILTVSRLMGHTTVKHTEKYINFIDDLKNKAINNLPSL